MPKECKLCGRYKDKFLHFNLHVENLLSEKASLQILRDSFLNTEVAYRIAAFQNPKFKKQLIKSFKPHTPFSTKAIISLATKVEKLVEGVYGDERREAYELHISKMPEFKAITKPLFKTVAMMSELYLDYKSRYDSNVELDMWEFSCTPKAFLESLIWTGNTCDYPEIFLFDDISGTTALSEPIDQALSLYGFMEAKT